MKEQNSIVKELNQLAAVFEKILNIFIGIFVGVLGLSVFIGVLGRNINIPVVWLDEVSTYCCIWATFLGLPWPADMGCCPMWMHLSMAFLKGLKLI